MKMLSLKRTKRLYISIFCAITLLALTFTIVGAIKYTISTNDLTGVSEWFDQSIPVFQTDIIEGDPLRADEDIVNAWIATGVDNQLYFMVEFSGNPAINKPDQPYNGVGVWLDCNMDGDATDSGDRFLAYYYAAGYDRVSWFRSSDGYGESVDDANLGQVDQQFVEWTIDPSFGNGFKQCQTQLNVKFGSVQALNAVGYDSIMDETDSFRGFDFPTSIKDSNFYASTSRSNKSFWVFSGMGIVGLFLLTRFFIKKVHK